MNIDDFFRQLDEYFRKNELDKAEPFLVGSLEQAKETEDYAAYIAVGNEMIGFYRSVSMFRKAFDIVLGHNARMDVIFIGIVFGGQAKSIETDGKQHVIVLHPFFTADDVHSGKWPGVAHMQTLSRGVRKFNESVKFGTLISGDCGEWLFLAPFILPLFLDGGKIVLHSLCILLSI